MSQETNGMMEGWLALTQIQLSVAAKLEQELQSKHNWSLNDFYLLYFLSVAPDKKLRLQQLETMIGLSQSAVSRLVSRFEARGCGALRRHVCEEDRRSVYTALTEIGEAEVAAAYDTFIRVLRESLPERELEAAVETMLAVNAPASEANVSGD
ncbi:MarR family winged helix-turn-helix transcriptional regulator [Gorillibacterium timonense]|uniref:MarR family winged helix-turn-helix transcriptional regulator n=1 Tax=Gorillibacterium timonense TaxID=1689269 RepID=UPI00071DD75E|nr:MarR family transcriptional regulator [Gorillibacterium timonense]